MYSLYLKIYDYICVDLLVNDTDIVESMIETESGFIGEIDVTDTLANRITDVEILSVSQVNIVARGRRYGRMWLLKGLSPEFRYSTIGRRRLLKEFEIHSRLCHPSVVQAVTIEDVDELGLCIVLEWVEGCTLADLLRDGKLSVNERRRIMHDIVSTVDYLHRNGIVHRDLKPSNIMVRNAGRQVVIIDFGLADTDSHTELKQSAGTPGFISPEQITDGGADPADDVYSLGVIMNEVCPEYKRVIRLCIGPNRPVDAGALLEIMDKRHRRKRQIKLSAVLVCMLVLGGLATWRIVMLGEKSKQSERRVEILMQNNQRNAEYVRVLSDSLSNVHSRMEVAQNELNETKAYSALYETLLKEGYTQIADMYDRYEKTISTDIEPDDNVGLAPVMQRLDNERHQIISLLCKNAINSGLKSYDLNRLKGDLYNYSAVEGNNRYKKWMNR